MSPYRPVCALIFTVAVLFVLLPGRSGAQLSLQRAVDLTAQQRSRTVPDLGRKGDDFTGCDESSRLLQVQTSAESPTDNLLDAPLPILGTLLDLDSIQTRFAGNALNSATKSTGAQLRSPGFSNEDGNRPFILCTVVAFTQLATVTSQLEILHLQQTAADRLLATETQRVVGRVDSPVALSRAKLIVARTRMWTAGLKGTSFQLRNQLAALSGLPEEQVEPVGDSVPQLPDVSTSDPEVRAIISAVSAARDVAQLEHVLARTYRMSVREREVVGKANVGDFLEACIKEYERFVVLLEANLELQKSQLELLNATGGLETWALHTASEENISGVATVNRTTAGPRTMPSAKNPAVRTVMITPGVSSFVTGQPQQFSAIATYDNAGAKNATSEAIWRCSNSKAIMSTSGLLTALATGQVTISATVDGISQTRRITITTADPLP